MRRSGEEQKKLRRFILQLPFFFRLVLGRLRLGRKKYRRIQEGMPDGMFETRLILIWRMLAEEREETGLWWFSFLS